MSVCISIMFFIIFFIIHNSLYFFQDYTTKEERMNLRYKAAEISIIFYFLSFVLAFTLLLIIIVSIPTNPAFPFSYAYTAYLNEYISQYTMYVAFMLEIVFITSFVSKICWFLTYLQIYMIVLSSCSKILGYENVHT